MTDKTAQIVAQYVSHVFAQAHVRPYENKSALSNQVTGELHIEALPEASHWRLTIALSVSGHNAQGVPCFETGAEVEGIVFMSGLADEEIEPVLLNNIAPLLVGNIRAAITTAAMSTGYGPVVLPPMSSAQLQALAQQSASNASQT